MFKVVENMDFRLSFIQRLKSIYIPQKAEIMVNGELMEPCEIQKGKEGRSKGRLKKTGKQNWI